MMVVLKLSVRHIFVRYYSAETQLVPVIKVPAYVKKYTELAKKAHALKQLEIKKRISYRGNTSFPVISSTNKEFNFYLGQIYNQRYALPLQSERWFNKQSPGQKFTIHPWDTNPSLPVLQNPRHENEVYFPTTFSELLTNETVLQELKNKGFESPTPIQVLAMPHILERKHMLLASETGCGKTVSYLAPIIQNLSSVKKSTKLFTNTPLALVITPGRELAEQIGTVAYDLAKNSNVNVKLIVRGSTKHEHLKLKENEDVDLLIATFGTISKLVTKGIFKLGNLRHLVLDEADTLLDESFIKGVGPLLRKIPLLINKAESINDPYGTQLILVSSVYPVTAPSLLAELFEHEEDLVKIKSPYLHRVMPHVKQRFWRVSNDGRAGDLLALVKPDFLKKIPTMIFCTHISTCEWVYNFLETNGVRSVRFHSGLNPAKRSNDLEKFQSGLEYVMCCTDIASRGIDTQHVKHVINFDFPTSVSDYILRAGRVGRVGSNQGYVTSLVVSAAGVHTLQEIERAVRLTTRIPGVDSNIKKKIEKLYFEL